MKLAFRGVLGALFALSIGTQVFAQVGVIKGEVKDSQGTPLKDVLIKIEGMDVKRHYEVKTNKEGKYYHGGVTLQGVYRVVAQKEGLTSDYVENVRPAFGGDDETRGVINFTLEKGQSGPLSFELTPEQRAQLQKQQEEAKKQQEMVAEVRQNFNLGIELSSQGKFAEAIDAYKKALEKAPEQPYIWANLANAHAKLKQNDAAIEAFNKAVTLKTDDPALFQNLGNVYGEVGNIEKAKENFEKAAALSAATNPKDAAVNYYNLAVIFINSGKNKDAAETLQKAVEADSSHAQAHYQLGIVLLGLNKVPDSLTHLKKYLELQPTGADAETAKALIEQLSK